MRIHMLFLVTVSTILATSIQTFAESCVPADPAAKLQGFLRMTVQSPLWLYATDKGFSEYGSIQGAIFDKTGALLKPDLSFQGMMLSRPDELACQVIFSSWPMANSFRDRKVTVGTVIPLKQAEIALKQDCPAGDECLSQLELGVSYVSFSNPLTFVGGMLVQKADGTIYSVTCKGKDLRVGDLLNVLPPEAVTIETCAQ